MHIGFITPEYPHAQLSKAGGLGTSIKNLANSMAGEGFKVTVFVVNQKTDDIVNDGEVQIHSIALRKSPFLQWYFNKKRINRYINQIVEDQQINALEAPDWTGITSFMKFKVPLVIRLNGSDGYFCHLDGRKQKLKNYILERFALKNADRIISASTFTGELTNKVFNLNRNITTIHNCINIEDFSPIEGNINTGEVLYFGTLVRKKGVLELASIFNIVSQKMPEATFVLIGKDNPDIFEKKSTYKLFLDRLTSQAKEKTKHIEEIPYSEVKQRIAKANVVVLPSFAEAFPMTWLETLAMEKALVSSDVGWAKELMVHGETGFTVDPRNHQEYADRIIELLQDKGLCEKVGKLGRKRVIEKFSTNEITKQNMAFYRTLISKK